MIRAAKLVGVFFVAMVGQWWLSTRANIGGMAPQVLLVLVVAVASRQGPVRAMTMGFFWGLFLDTLSAHLFGANALLLTLVGWGTGSVRRQIDVAGLGPQCAVILMMTLAYFVTLGLLGLVFMRHFLWVGWLNFLVLPLLNCAMAALIYLFWRPEYEQARGL